MKKVSLLAASVAFALTGCGGSDGDSSGAAPGGVVITGFDGYFKNAVVFVDSETEGTLGVWDLSSDQFLGLTDSKGQINLGSTKPAGTLALQTVKPNGPAQDNLLSIDPDKYAGIYTVDMDLPSQPIEHELVFRAPNNSNVISPITDLVAIEVAGGKTLEEAEDAVALSLGGTTDELYTDFVAKAESGDSDAAVLHKTAQILTETKAQDPQKYENDVKNGSKDFAKDAKEVADDLSDDQLKDPTFVAPVDGTPESDGGAVEKPTYKTMVDNEVYNTIQDTFDELELNLGDSGDNSFQFSIPIDGLFTDNDLPNGIELTVYDGETGNAELDTSELANSNIHVAIYDNYNGEGKDIIALGIEGTSSISKAGTFEVTLKLRATDSDNYSETEAKFSFNVNEGEATAPELDQDVADTLQDNVDAWEDQLIVGSHKFFNLDYAGLFASDDIESVIVSSNLITNGFVFGTDASSETSILLSGAPLRSSDDNNTDYIIKITATNTAGLTTTVELQVPEIAPEVDEEFPGIKPIEDFDNQEECEDNGGYWYDNSCHADPKPTDPDPVDPVKPKLAFTQEHFTKGGTWHMGSFDNGDAEVGYASLRVNNEQNEFCFASDDPQQNNTLTRESWKTTLINLDEGTGVVTPEDCGPATINADGTITLLEDGGAEELTLTMLYQNMNGTDYQIIMKSNEGELFWLDSTDTRFEVFGNAMAKDSYTEHFLIDDHTHEWKIEPLVDVFTYTETTRIPSETIIAEGTYDAYSLTEKGETWTGNWSVVEEIQGIGQVTIFPDMNDDVNPPVAIERQRHAYRDFGDIQIGIGDSDKDDDLGDNGFFYITSDDQAVIEGLYSAWAGIVPTLNPAPLLNKDMFLIETAEDDAESQLNVCLAFHLEGDAASGVVYFNAENTSTDLTKACDPATVEGGTYTIENNIITVEEPGYGSMTFKLLDVQDDNGSIRAVVHTEEESDDGYPYYSVFESYESKVEAEARIATEVGGDDWDKLSQLTTMWVDGKFVEVYVTPQARNNPTGSEADDAADADIFFDRVNGDITCYDLRNNFDYVAFDGMIQQSLWNDCYDKEENGYKYASVDLDFNTEIEIGSHAINFSSANGHEVQSINRNIIFKSNSSYE
jgi:hypothetical protein